MRRREGDLRLVDLTPPYYSQRAVFASPLSAFFILQYFWFLLTNFNTSPLQSEEND